MPRISTRRRTAVLCAGLAALAACTTSTEASDGGSSAELVADDSPAVPLPTIGLGSEFGEVSSSNGATAANASDVDSIVMIGDSITVASSEAIEEQFSQIGFDNVTIVAQQGKRISESFGDNTSGASIADYVADEYTGDPQDRLWIVALGTNDISQYADAAEVSDVVDSVLESIPPEAPLLWVNTYIEDRPADTAAVNAAISRAVAERGNATVGSWSSYAPENGVLSDDGVHPTDQGEITFASVVTTSAANFLGR
ncbi:GDSL-type esterase/lipase family protein [Ilumatobacter sp.]|uniref:GDSL-type esterase/lipase family protein n=1 Tax=Ilumatobacter sp. TaxID=1967498 RepID=UPI003C3483F5